MIISPSCLLIILFLHLINMMPRITGARTASDSTLGQTICYFGQCLSNVTNMSWKLWVSQFREHFPTSSMLASQCNFMSWHLMRRLTALYAHREPQNVTYHFANFKATIRLPSRLVYFFRRILLKLYGYSPFGKQSSRATSIYRSFSKNGSEVW